MIAGLDAISNGDVFIGDRRVNEMSPKDRGIAIEGLEGIPDINLVGEKPIGRRADVGEVARQGRRADDVLARPDDVVFP